MSDAAASSILRLAAFTALAVFASAHWAALVTDPPILRAMLCVLVVAACGGGLILVGRAAAEPLQRTVLAALVALAGLTVGLAVVGMPLRLMVPWNWAELGDVLATGLEGIEDVNYPYAGDHPWSRQVILFALPLWLMIAAAVAFWPRRGASQLGRGALAILVALYATAVITDSASQPLLRGLLLFLLVAAWLWLPRVRPRQALPAIGLVLACGALAVPAASAVNAEKPWIDYRDWRLDFSSSRGSGERFDWNHSYGSLDWIRTGKRLLEVQSDGPHYWRAAVLDTFDGVRWRASSEPPSIPLELGQTGRAAVLARIEERWVDWVEFEVEALQSPVVITPGLALSARGDDVSLGAGEASARDGALEEGDTYALLAYAPAPSEKQMRSAPADHPAAMEPFVSIEDAEAYGPVHALARTWAADAPTTYDAVKAIEARLQNDFVYDEDPPESRYPLRDFLLVDRIGYCQQFSGSMALMLRTLGIPARVAAGFSPGERDGDRFTVRDSDAHSWVEVYFSGIGWVPFDPTPSDAPAQSQAAGLPAPPLPLRPNSAPDRRPQSNPVEQRAGAPNGSGGAFPLWIPGAAVVALVLLIAVPAGLRRRRWAALPGARLAEAQLRELEAALGRLGRPVAGGTTLRALEHRHGRRSAVAAYVERLRRVRYGPAGSQPPTLAQRRRVRRELSSRGGLRSRARGLLAIPLGGPRAGILR
jgi:hypothetical protein